MSAIRAARRKRLWLLAQGLLFALFALFTLFTGACSHSPELPDVPTIPDSQNKPAIAWRNFAYNSQQAAENKSPYRINATLRYETPSESQRVSGYLWGNGEVANKPGRSGFYPIRLDLIAGVGSVVAKVKEDSTRFLVFDPSANTAYNYEGKNRTLSSFGVPVPFDLASLVLVLQGRYADFFLPQRSAAEQAAPPPARPARQNGQNGQAGQEGQAGYVYTLQDHDLPGELQLDENGQPLRWSHTPGPNGADQSWVMEITPGKGPGPLRLRLTHPKGYEAVITVKELARPEAMFLPPQLELELPAGARRENVRQ